MAIFTRPICIVFIVLSIGSMVFSVINQRKIQKRSGTVIGDGKVEDLAEAIEEGKGDVE